MKFKCFLALFIISAAIACNNEASVQDESDTVIHTQDSNQSIYPAPGDVLGDDTIPAHEQNKNPTLQKK